MFSSKELISFVFLNQNDIYYGADLVRRDQDRYLWDLLHDSYDAVYYLGAAGNCFQVRSFGDLKCSKYTPSKKGFFSKLSNKTEIKEQGAWLLRQLRAKPGATAAFVCPLEDFCSVLSDPDWDETLETIAKEKKRTGIFVLTASATAEESQSYLLNSPVFEKLEEKVIMDLRGGELRDLYGSIYKDKWDSCLFLNDFTWERIRALLLHIAVENPQLCVNSEQLDQMTEYLRTYLRDTEMLFADPLFVCKEPACYLMYKDLYANLRQERVWGKLKRKSERFAQQEMEREHSGTGEPIIPILRERNSYAGKCIKLRLPLWLMENGQEREQAEVLVQGIRNVVSRPRNRMENKQIAELAETLIQMLDTIQQADWETCRRVLEALKFCVERACTAPGDHEAEQVLKIIGHQQEAISVSRLCFQLRRNLELQRSLPGFSSLKSHKLAQSEKELQASEKMLNVYDDLIGTYIAELTMPATIGNVTEMVSRLEESLELVRNPEPVQETHTQEAADTAEEEEKQPEQEDLEKWLYAIYDSAPPIY